jgi:NADH-quinone oxidoreductase subunit H
MFMFLTFFIWVRASLPRFRFDQLMNFGWKILLPIGVVNLFGTAFIIAIAGPETSPWALGAALLIFGLALIVILEVGASNWRRRVMQAKYSRGTKLIPFAK